MPDTANIFISHKHEDQHAALGIKEVLSNFAPADRMKFFLSAEIPEGEPWFNWIRERLVESNFLLLLFTDATRSWDWCLYEAGLFTRLEGDDLRRVICLHSSNTRPPSPLQHLQAVPAEPERVGRFLNQLFVGTELTGGQEPLFPQLERLPDLVTTASRKIVGLIDRDLASKVYHANYMFLQIADRSEIQPDRIPPEAIVVSDASTLEIFGKGPRNWRWSEIEEQARESDDSRWIDELAMALHQASLGRVVEPIQATLRHHREEKFYRPVLYRVDTDADSCATFKILFSEDVTWRLDHVPTSLGALITSLVMGTRFRYELLERHGGDLVTLSEAAFASRCKEIRQTIDNVESESRSRGLLDRQRLMDIFAKPEHRQEIDQMFDVWYEIRAQLLSSLDSGDRPAIQEAMSELYRMNRRFMVLSSSRYAELMVEAAGSQASASRAAGPIAV